MHQAARGLTAASMNNARGAAADVCKSAKLLAASRACVTKHWQTRARGPCGTRSNAATRLPKRRRLQAGIDVALRSLPSRAKIDKQGTVVTSRRRPRCARLGRAATGLQAVVTGLECSTDAERRRCGATCPLRRCHSRHGYRLLLFAPSSIPHCRVCTDVARQAAGKLGVHCAPLQSACCNSRHAMTLHWGVRFFHPRIAHRRREAQLPRIGLAIVGITLPARAAPGCCVGAGRSVPARHLAGGELEWPPGRTGGPRIKPKENGAPVSSCSGPVACNSGWAADSFVYRSMLSVPRVLDGTQVNHLRS
jgi:hypothetical protein